MANCLLCGSGVWYVGLFNADCTNAGCANYREPPISFIPAPEYGTWAWGEKLQKVGFRLEYRERAKFLTWHDLHATLATTSVANGKDKYEFRLRQVHYAPKSEFDVGTEAWAHDMVDKGMRIRARGDEFEIIP